MTVPLLPEVIAPGAKYRNPDETWKSWAGVKVMSLASALPDREPDAVGVINYHRVHPIAGLPISLTPTAFHRQLGGLLARGYEAVTVSQICDAFEGGTPLSPRSFAVTFDDGFDNVRRYALPALEDLGIPATLMLTTGYVGADAFPFDPMIYGGASDGSVAAELWGEVVRPLTLEGCRELLDSGHFEIGCHTHAHRDFTGDAAAFREDMRLSLRWMADNLGIRRPTFSFPYGGEDAALRAVCRELKVRCALTTQADLIRRDSDPMSWGRFGGAEYDDGATLAAKVNGWYVAARRAWRRVAYGEVPTHSREIVGASS